MTIVIFEDNINIRYGHSLAIFDKMPAPPCLFCLRRIYSTSKAVTCDKCQRWHHIRCGYTGITEEEYDEAVRNQHELRFVCMKKAKATNKPPSSLI